MTEHTSGTASHRVVLGVDGGGTKTDICVATPQGEVIGFATGGGANWEGTGLEAVGDVLHRLIGIALERADRARTDVSAAAFCLAGVDWVSDQDRLAPHIDALGVGANRVITNDSFAALRAGTTAGHGCVSIAGTGGVAAGRNRGGQTARTMGVAIGEGAGAWGLVMGALGALAAEFHQSGPATALTSRLLQSTDSTDVTELFEGLSRGTKLVGGDLSVHVLDASREGDAVAQQICHDCGAQHGRDTAGVARKLDMTSDHFDVVMAGGVHVNAEQQFRAGFQAEVLAAAPNATLRTLEAPPAAGATLLALELLGINVEDLHTKVCEQAIEARAST